MANVSELSYMIKSTYDNAGVQASMTSNKQWFDSIDKGVAKLKAQLGTELPDVLRLSNNSIGGGNNTEQRQAAIALNAQKQDALNSQAEQLRQLDIDRRQAAVSLSSQRDAALKEEINAERQLDVERRQAFISLQAQKDAAIKEQFATEKAMDVERRQAQIALQSQKDSAIAESLAQKSLDKAYWAERGRMRDAELQKELSAAHQLDIQKRQAAIALQDQKMRAIDELAKFEQAKVTQNILGTVRAQQQAAISQNAWMSGKTGADLANQRMAMMALSSASGGGGKHFAGTMAIQQIGFGIQDFQSQMVNAKTTADGFGRGMMAVSNNVQMLGAAFGPTGLAVTAFGGALLGLAIPALVRWMDTSKSAREESERLSEQFKKEFDRRLALIEFATRTRLGKPGSAESAFEQADNNARVARAKESQIREDMAWKPFGKQSEDQKAREADRQATLKKQLAATMIEARQFENQADAIKDEAAAERKAREDKERKEKSAKDKLQEEKDQKELSEFQRDWKLRDVDEELKIENEKQQKIRDELGLLNEQGTTANGSSAAGIRGTSSAASAINRAMAGTKSEESDRKKLIRLAEEQLKTSQKIEAGLRLKKAEIKV